MTSFLHLPPELFRLIVRHVDQPSLKSLRLTCRTLRPATTAKLFHTVRLFPDDQSCDRMESLLDDPQQRELPRKIYINTLDQDFDPDDADQQPEAEWPKRWDTLLPRVKEFDNLRSAVLRLDRNYGAETEYWESSYPHSPAFRFRALDRFFSMVASLKLPLKELAIRNLQVDNPRSEKTREILANILPSLETLRLTIVSEYNEAAPEHDIERPEPHKFYQELPSTWLAPAANSLQHLSLVGQDYFGFYPKLDLSGIHFPHLKSLSLGNYTFSDDSQVEWILSHAATLEELFFDDCAVLYDVAIYEENLGRCAISKDETGFRRDDSQFLERKYFRFWDRRWHHLFHTFAEKLPNLRRFTMGSGRWRYGAPFEKEEDIRVGLFINRYMTCYDGYGPSCYIVRNHTLQEGERVSPECDREDQEALRMLLQKLGQTVQENYTMDDGSNVKDLVSDRRW
ncbi:F-box domain protein [Aspergillus ambiguus]|uniref:F-box protein n=1 Tax=Aspergillus ambiguus TaxID=176160 RepID=UPI003CCE0A92